ncbi:MAG: flagellar motor protein MotB [Phycisphaerae bacterium]|nr:flagellar motor protein MotB [Phycisphaerae bacterium]
MPDRRSQAMGMVKKKEKAGGGAPEWMVTYGDMMGLLLCFFIMLVSMSTINKQQFIEAIKSIQEALGFEDSYGQIPTLEPSQNSMMRRLESIIIPNRIKSIGDTDEEGLEGREYRVEQVREGLRITGGVLEFDCGSATPRKETVQVMDKLARDIRGHTTKIEVRGHTSLEPLPKTSAFKDHMDLSYARAKAIADLLIKSGVRPERIRLVACGSREPIRTQAYDEKHHARNRRVEVLVTEALVSDLVGDASVQGEQ